MDFFIQSEFAENLNEDEWDNIKILIDKFLSKFTSKRSHNKNYYKNKLKNSPFGKSIITRVINKKNECVGMLTLT